ncbi:Protein CutA [Hibiscus syriacus]|uniref:Protein CutA n=1 Tax=Hibiscus syriacus TaxID=106335 RepID=A0A6A2Y7U0_HIBSY|nr:protein CutA, chloroplastic-like [Hibiscus syriacus]KAE8669469.1 Protein CutA [Hibiscus syriacus]
MATNLCCRALVSSTTRFQLVGAVSTLSSSSYSSYYLKTGCAQSLPFVRLLRSKFSTQTPDKTVRAVKMEANSNTVPSIVVYVTVPNREAGRKLAGSIVKEKLAACVNIVPGVESVYEWEGKINTDPEELLIIKTRQSLLPALTEHVNANHEYDVPEVIALPIDGGSPQYLEWLKNSTRD